MKVMERIDRNHYQIPIDNMQFGFMPGRGTTDAIFIFRLLQEKYLAKNKKLFFAFVDLERAFERVIWWAVRKLGIDELIVCFVQTMYHNTKSKVKNTSIYHRTRSSYERVPHWDTLVVAIRK